MQVRTSIRVATIATMIEVSGTAVFGEDSGFASGSCDLCRQHLVQHNTYVTLIYYTMSLAKYRRISSPSQPRHAWSYSELSLGVWYIGQTSLTYLNFRPPV